MVKHVIMSSNNTPPPVFLGLNIPPTNTNIYQIIMHNTKTNKSVLFTGLGFLTYDGDSLTELLLNRQGGGEHEIDDKSFDLGPVSLVDFVLTFFANFPVALDIVLEGNGPSNL